MLILIILQYQFYIVNYVIMILLLISLHYLIDHTNLKYSWIIKILFILMCYLILFSPPLLSHRVMSDLIKSLIMFILICQSSILVLFLLQIPDPCNSNSLLQINLNLNMMLCTIIYWNITYDILLIFHSIVNYFLITNIHY
jgi:hypothetical protein